MYLSRGNNCILSGLRAITNQKTATQICLQLSLPEASSLVAGVKLTETNRHTCTLHSKGLPALPCGCLSGSHSPSYTPIPGCSTWNLHIAVLCPQGYKGKKTQQYGIFTPASGKSPPHTHTHTFVGVAKVRSLLSYWISVPPLCQCFRTTEMGGGGWRLASRAGAEARGPCHPALTPCRWCWRSPGWPESWEAA